MSYGLIYTVPFASLDNEACVVEIEKEGYSGKVTELIAGTSPFTVDIESEEFLYTSTRFSTATIRIVGSDYLQSLFTIAYQQYRVTFKKDEVITWCGFIKPELYTQDYSSDTFELELECMSAMSSLEFIDYSQVGENRAFVSLWDLLKKCISSAKAQYEGVYIPHVYGPDEIEYTSENNVLEEMTISEQNFFDEDDKPMKLQEVLEEICKFLNWTCVDWRGDLYFVDIDHLGEYRIFDSVSFDWAGDTVSPESNNLQRIGFAGSDHTLDILPGFNKVTLKCSNYPVSESIQEEDFDKLEVLQTPADATPNNMVSRREFLRPDKYEMINYAKSNGALLEINLNHYVGNMNDLFGGVLLRYCTYNLKLVNGEKVPTITDYSFVNVIQVRMRSNKSEENSLYASHTPIMRIKGESMVYSDGAFAIQGSRKASFGDNLFPIPSERDEEAPADVAIQLRIGNNYYNGSSWVSSPSVFNIRLDRSGGLKEFLNIPNTKTLSMPYTGLSGFVIPINKKLSGNLELTLYAPMPDESYFVPYGYWFKDFKLVYQKKDGEQDDSTSNSDRIYENVVNENYINELDEIEFKISSYNDDGACYSKVMLGEKYLTDNLYSDIEKTYIRPEEQLIRRIIKRYSAPRIKLTQVIKEPSDLTPISRLYDNYMVNKRFINIGGTIDYVMNQFQCIMIEV